MRPIRKVTPNWSLRWALSPQSQNRRHNRNQTSENGRKGSDPTGQHCLSGFELLLAVTSHCEAQNPRLAAANQKRRLALRNAATIFAIEHQGGRISPNKRQIPVG